MNTFLAYIADNLGAIGIALAQHIGIVAAALALAVPVGIAAGIALAHARSRAARTAVFYLLGLGQTIPSLALLALAVGLLGVGLLPAIVALLLYAILPIARNACTGVQSVPEATRDAARGLGMTNMQIIRRVELPLARPFIIAGLRTATVVTISSCALASLIGAGGLGDFIFSGISLFKPEAMLAGAIPTAMLALAADWFLGRWAARGHAVR
ncbi:MAG TPA: ABC transporter permease [Candidatus Kapabacteria bacterium]|nr:ABC transporter permease [Candidatus Kapabacteria bacterium]